MSGRTIIYMCTPFIEQTSVYSMFQATCYLQPQAVIVYCKFLYYRVPLFWRFVHHQQLDIPKFWPFVCSSKDDKNVRTKSIQKVQYSVLVNYRLLDACLFKSIHNYITGILEIASINQRACSGFNSDIRRSGLLNCT